MQPIDLLLTRLRQSVADARAALRKQHDEHLLGQEKVDGDSFADGTRAAGEALRLAMAELRGAESAATAARQGRNVTTKG